MVRVLRSLTARPWPLLVRRTLRKHPGLVGAVTVLSLVSGLLMNVGLVMMTQHGAYLEHKADEWNSPDDATLIPQGEQADAVTAALHSEPRVREVETSSMVGVLGSIPYAGSTLPSRFLFYDIDSTPQMGRWDVISQLADPVEDPVWVPATFQASGGYKLGDALVLTSPAGERTFHIQGFTESTYGGMPAIGLLWLGVPGSSYRQLESQAREHVAGLQAAADGEAAGARQLNRAPGWVPFTLIKVRTDAAGDDTVVSDVLTHLDVTATWDMTRTTVSMANQISVSLTSVVILLFSSMITVMALLILTSMLRSAVREDLATVGALRATGFTTGGVMRPMVLCLTLVAAAGGVVGAALGYAVLPYLSSLLRAQAGITWRARFDLGLLLVCAAVLGLLVWVGGALAARRASRMSVVEALRGGQADHSFARARLPLERVHGPLVVLLGLKKVLAAPGRAALILVVTGACTTASVFSASGLGTLADRDNALSLLLGGVFPDVTVTTQSPGDLDQVMAQIRQTDGVASALPYSQHSERVNGTGILLIAVDRVEDLPVNPVYEGRPARHANEVVLGPGLQRPGVRVGGTWTMTHSGTKKEFLVTGLASGVVNGGSFAILTRQAYQELVPDAQLNDVGVFTSPGTSSEAVTRTLQNELGPTVQVLNIRDAMAVQLESYTSVVPLLSRTLMVFTGLVVVLVVALMTTSLVARSRRTSGLLKALGMTSRQAAAQVRWTILPPLVLGTVLGCVVGGVLVMPLLEVMLSGVGIRKITVGIPLWPTLAVGAVVLLTAVAATVAATRPVRKVTAYCLLTE